MHLPQCFLFNSTVQICKPASLRSWLMILVMFPIPLQFVSSISLITTSYILKQHTVRANDSDQVSLTGIVDNGHCLTPYNHVKRIQEKSLSSSGWSHSLLPPQPGLTASFPLRKDGYKTIHKTFQQGLMNVELMMQKMPKLMYLVSERIVTTVVGRVLLRQ